MSERPRRTVHYTELVEAGPESQLAAEWNCYRREVGRLIAEGNEGRFVLIKGEQIIGIWDTEREAHIEGARRFLMQSFFVHQILTWEPVYVQRIGYN
jgi:hypothetical protein